MKKCPECGCEKFYVTAHVVEEWLVDANGDYIDTHESCVDIAHYPDDEDIWTCSNCSHEGAGSEFEIKN